MRYRAEELESALAEVRLAAFDADGILTDGTILCFADGDDAMAFCARDGLGLKLLMDEGVAVAIISARRSEALAKRAEMLGIRLVVRGTPDKALSLRQVSESAGVPLSATLFAGDDLPDLPAMAAAGIAATVPEAPEVVRARADLVTRRAGGHGAVREIAERVLHAKGRWNSALRRYLEER